MSISKAEQRVLHALAQGGCIQHERSGEGRIVAITCFTREGYGLGGCDLPVFRKLKARRLIGSREGGPYRLTRLGRQAVRAQPDNR